jgi:hypothetical protein
MSGESEVQQRVSNQEAACYVSRYRSSFQIKARDICKNDGKDRNMRDSKNVSANRVCQITEQRE